MIESMSKTFILNTQMFILTSKKECIFLGLMYVFCLCVVGPVVRDSDTPPGRESWQYCPCNAAVQTQTRAW